MAPHSPQLRPDDIDDHHDHAGTAFSQAHARWNASNWTLSGNGGGGSGPDKVKCVFIGDGAVGKTSLIISYTTNGYPSEYTPTAIDTYDVVVHVDGTPVTFELCDTPGQSDFDTLRPLCYPNTDVFLVCFSVVCPSSFANVREKWIPEVRKSIAAAAGKSGATKKSRRRSGRRSSSAMPPIVLVGTQSDLREDATTLVQLAKSREAPVTEQEARKLASQLGCECYIESSSLTQRNLKEVFDEAIVAGLKGRRRKEKKRAKAKIRQQKQQEQREGCKTCCIL